MRSDGVSEVVGEMLLLVVVVILAAVLSSNVGSLMPEFSAPPHATFLGVKTANINITHTGGEALDLKEIKIAVFDVKNLTQSTYIFDGEKLVDENGDAKGKLHGDGDSLWEFGEVLELNVSAGVVKIVHPDGVVCRMYFGDAE